jgi:dihydrofolate reductase
VSLQAFGINRQGPAGKAQPGGDLVLGGADLAAAIMGADLIDEYRIYVHPVAIGGGKLLPECLTHTTDP